MNEIKLTRAAFQKWYLGPHSSASWTAWDSLVAEATKPKLIEAWAVQIGCRHTLFHDEIKAISWAKENSGRVVHLIEKGE